MISHALTSAGPQGYCYNLSLNACADPGRCGAGGSDPPPEKSHNIVFLSNTCPDPL